MSTTSNKLPWILVTLLVALNMLVLILVWFRPPGPPPPMGDGRPGEGRPGEGRPGGLAREIGMTEAEAEKMRPLQDAHFAKLDELQSELVKHRQEAFAQFGQPQADSAAAMAALEKVGAVQVAIEKERYRHFYEVLALCTPDEAKHFQELMPKILARRHQPENRPQGMPPGDGPPR